MHLCETSEQVDDSSANKHVTQTGPFRILDLTQSPNVLLNEVVLNPGIKKKSLSFNISKIHYISLQPSGRNSFEWHACSHLNQWLFIDLLARFTQVHDFGQIANRRGWESALEQSQICDKLAVLIHMWVANCNCNLRNTFSEDVLDRPRLRIWTCPTYVRMWSLAQ